MKASSEKNKKNFAFSQVIIYGLFGCSIELKLCSWFSAEFDGWTPSEFEKHNSGTHQKQKNIMA